MLTFKMRHAAETTGPMFETLEERLLLTTLVGGEYFIYHNRAGSNVRIEMPYTGKVELFALEQGEVVDLVGLRNGYQPVNWP